MLPSSIQLRAILPGDGHALRRVFVDAVYGLGVECYTKYQLDAWVSGVTAERLEARTIAMKSFAALEANRIVGFGSLDSDLCELDYLYVHPNCSGKGIGRKLAEKIERKASKMGIEHLHLTASLNAVAIYERFGYEWVADMSKTIRGVAIPCVRMTKHLTGNR
jgi:GNAT superfamily N-acetyltransferase